MQNLNMKDTFFNITVKKILKNKWKIIDSEKVKNIVKEVMGENYNNNKAYKMIYYMKNRWYLIALKKDIFFVKDKNIEINEYEIQDKFYWDILKKQCNKYLWNDRYIWWIKALELNLQNISIPEEIDIINEIKQSKEVVITSKYINFKKYKSNKNINTFKKLKKFCNKEKIWKYSFPYSWLELSILESLYSPDILWERYKNELVKKAIRKYKKIINYNVLSEIIKLGKHHTSINRMYKIWNSIDPKIWKLIWDIIKKESFFLDT